MSKIKGRGNKTTEWRLRLLLVSIKISGWRLHEKSLHGTPDFFFPGRRMAVFVDGCFWHGCLRCFRMPKTNSAFWKNKIKNNKKRDMKTNKELKNMEIKVVRIWEHELKNRAAMIKKIRELFL